MHILRHYFISLLLLSILPIEARASSATVLYDERFLLHDAGAGHPEKPDRLGYIVQHLRQHKTLSAHLRWPSFSAATRENLRAVHQDTYLDLLDAEQQQLTTTRPYLTLSTGDTVISKKSIEVAKLASGAAMAGIDAVMQHNTKSAFALARPPGHHATADRGMGFCIYNHVAVAARYAQKKYGVQRVLIMDIDVHHGNGTQDIFDQDDSVFYFSAHQHPLYPGSGRPAEKGHGKGAGYTMNVDVPFGSDEAIILKALASQLEPAMQRFRPELILVSAGLDAHQNDLLGGLRYTDAGYASIAQQVVKLANLYAQGRTVWVLEGGYVPENNSNAVEAILEVLIGQ
ncbi:MAG: histone deacetylase [Methylophilus sp.]|uniref:histone deacetylase family protein n=1 Tax=Methylophilus sp. TaxID=29541 RepID=UPI002CAE3A2E|nr:histone deacetylase [Methylophilus sp.]HSH85696.1 histone deacetylase [Methylophilus sp.]